SPRRLTAPASARYKPESRLIVVVFPDPFGPMRPLISPGRIAKDRLSTATSPPNRFVKPRVSSNHPFSDTLPPASPCPIHSLLTIPPCFCQSRQKLRRW